MAIMDLFTSLQTIVNERLAKDVRQAIHDGVYRANQVADENKDLVDHVAIRQDAVEQFNNQVIQEMTDKDVISAPEIIQARGDKATLGQRFDETAIQLAQKGVDVTYPGGSLPIAVGDGVTDDTYAIKTIYDNLSENEILFIPSKKFRVNNLMFDRDNINIICYGELVQASTDNGVAVEVSGRNQTISGVLKVSKLGEIDHTKDTIGMRLYNAYMNKVNVSIKGFRTNLLLYADSGQGVSYNEINLINLSGGKTNLLLDTVSEDSSDGWVNENIFTNGRFGTYTDDAEVRDGETIKQAATRSGITHIKINKTHINNNLFIKPSLEYHGMTFIDCKGRYNTFLSPRLEGDSVLINWRTGSIYNDVIYPYHHVDFSDENYYSNGSRNHLHGRNFTDLEAHDFKASSFKAHGVPIGSTAFDPTEGVFDAYNQYSNAIKNFRGRDVNGVETFSVTATGDTTTETLAVKSQAIWRTLTFRAGVESNRSDNPVQIYKNSLGDVVFKGELKVTEAKAHSDEILYLPEEYRPSSNVYLASVKRGTSSGTVVAIALEVLTSGQVRMYYAGASAGEVILLDNLKFRSN